MYLYKLYNICLAHITCALRVFKWGGVRCQGVRRPAQDTRAGKGQSMRAGGLAGTVGAS